MGMEAIEMLVVINCGFSKCEVKAQPIRHVTQAPQLVRLRS